MGSQLQKPLIGTQINWGHPLSRGIVACYLMNEGAGNRIYDLSLNGNDGLVNGAIWTASTKSTVLQFANDDINIPDTDRLDFGDTDSFSIVILARASVISQDSQRLVDKYSGGGTAGYYVAYDSTSGHKGKIVLVLYPTLTQIRSNNFPGNDLAWHHIVAVKEEGVGVHMYIDGVLHNTGPDNTTGSHANAEPFRIGSFNGAGIAEFTGDMGVVLVYNRALSPQEISELYLNPYGMFQHVPIWMWATPVVAPLYNFIAKPTTFNFNAKTKAFNFNAKPIHFNFNAKAGPQ